MQDVNVNTITTPEAWHRERLRGIGASESSAVIGCNPYMSNVDLWRVKTGRKRAADISNVACVQYGHAAEDPIRQLFALDYPEYEVSYGGAFDLVRNPEYPFIFATLDGRLVEKSTGRRGVLEIKTTEILRSMQNEKWSGQIPNNYFCQVCHQLIATGFDFAVLHAQLKFGSGFYWGVRTERRTYFIERAEVQDSIDYLLAGEVKFWREYVEKDKEPPLILPEI